MNKEFVGNDQAIVRIGTDSILIQLRTLIIIIDWESKLEFFAIQFVSRYSD